MGLIADVLHQMQGHLLDAVPVATDVQIYRGKLTSEDVMKISVTPGSLLLAFLGGEPVKATGGQIRLGATFGVFALTDGPLAVDDGLDLMEGAAVALADWFPAGNGRVLSAHPGDIEPVDANQAQQVQLWGLSWGFTVALGQQSFAADDDTVPAGNVIPVEVNGDTAEAPDDAL